MRQTAFLAASGLALAVLLIQVVLLPRVPAQHVVRLAHFSGLFRSRKIVGILVTVIFMVSGHYVVYTFVTPSLLSALLLGYGLLTVVGHFVGGAFAGRRLKETVLVTVLVFTGALTFAAVAGTNVIVMAMVLAVWALAWGAAPVATQLWLFDAAPESHSIDAAQAMNTSFFQLAIGLGSLVGAVAVNTTGLRSTAGIGGAVLALTAISVIRLLRSTAETADESTWAAARS